MSYPLRQTISPNVNTNLNDVFGVKLALNALGDLEIQDDDELHEYPNEELFTSIKRFQARNGLEVDGVMKPKGPTATALGFELFGTAAPHQKSELPQAAAADADECYRRYEETFRLAEHLPADAELVLQRSAMLQQRLDWPPAWRARRICLRCHRSALEMMLSNQIRLSGKSADGETLFEALIFPSTESGGDEDFAIVRCAALFDGDRKIYGADLHQALSLAEKLVRDVWRDRHIRIVRREVIEQT